jgi:hypothetical protein
VVIVGLPLAAKLMAHVPWDTITQGAALFDGCRSYVKRCSANYTSGDSLAGYFRTDESGVVLIMNLTNPNEAPEHLEKLPLGQAGMMEFEFIPLGPIKPLGLLLNEPGK